ncbi:Uncharacterised protein [Mycobacteroides abscessus subsp. abscessus]|uniref:hypothetical protein n=1 Tax=Mycobacteroides abscessus TaxID=36809 RepID=UPI0009295F33|nr:hypothetical protein [Mycobacteroides abscessus]SHY23876.1 Uncharacterised protein [Mycobacteroides abscessus subsp. abscessus]SIC83192.1 Uncharacterised protein [Mycobacteroides abscessus subsp. abscessus]SKK29712.1 Uncharacterised protein [Mycobacteroides abscessus subsp. abscessus]SKP23729.1 Uncharacterised protein [Mycobacteroides abscessus subsp. abscessus]
MRNVQVQVAQNPSTEVWTVHIPEFGLTIGGAGDRSSICHSVAGCIASAKAAHHSGDVAVVASPAEEGVIASIYTREDLGGGVVMATSESFAQRENAMTEFYKSLVEGSVVCVIRPQRIDPRALDKELDELYKKFRK